MACSRRKQQDGSSPGGGSAPADDAAVLSALVGRARAGDQRALADIVDLCSPMLRSVAGRYLRAPWDVDDAVQDAWLSFTQNLHRIETPAATRAWLVRVGRHAAWRVSRRAAQVTACADLGDRPAPDDTEEAGVRRAHDAETRPAVQAAIARLQAPERQLIGLLMAEDRLDYRSIAEAVDRPVGSIGPTRQRILARLGHDRCLAGVATEW